MKRMWVLTSYMLRELFRSLTGAIIIVIALVFYLVAIQSVIGGVDRDYYALVIGGFFSLFSLFVAAIIADRAYRASSYLLLYRLPTRVAFLAAITLAAVLTAGCLEIVVAAVSLIRLVAPLTPAMIMDVLPVWIAWLVLGATLGLHMSELVRRGWSRTIVYALLAFILFSLNQQQSGVPVGLTDRFSWFPRLTPDPARWEWATKIVGGLLWPISATIRVAREAPYSALESLSPAVLLLVGLAIFGMATILFDSKDLILPES